ncbi:MAG: dihydrolipoyl dehydrogenase [Oscillospiraceae bacterium]|nr:dihydrolipoyl dehydrogenase [Oscillospiraceae bacterium]
MKNYDLIVIGAGPGGYEAALHAAKLGLKTALVERRDVGGTCLNRGCIPTKTLLHSAELYHEAKEAETFGINTENVTYDLPAVFARKQAVVEKLRSGVEQLLKSAKVEILRGTGTVLGTGRVRVTNAEGESEYGCDNILCATGSVPARPPIPGLELAMTSDELLEGAETLFKSLIIIGGGVIGVELATFYADLGCPVTILEGLDRLLPNMDKELGQNLAMQLKKRGVAIQTGAMVKGVERSENGLRVRYEQKGKEGAAEAEAVLCAIGRAPYSKDLFAEGLEVAYDRRRVHVDQHFATSIPGVYAIGDVSSPVQLAHVATAQGIACVDEIAGNGPTQNLSLVPGCVYTRPEIATVGLTEAKAKEKGIPVKTAKGLLSANGRTVILEGERGFMKLVANAETGKLIGAALMCERATDMISQLSLAMSKELTVKDLLGIIRPHPTFEEALGSALAELEKKLEA